MNTQCFNPEKVFSMKGLEEHFPAIISQVKERVLDVFMDFDFTSHPPSYFSELV